MTASTATPGSISADVGETCRANRSARVRPLPICATTVEPAEVPISTSAPSTARAAVVTRRRCRSERPSPKRFPRHRRRPAPTHVSSSCHPLNQRVQRDPGRRTQILGLQLMSRRIRQHQIAADLQIASTWTNSPGSMSCHRAASSIGSVANTTDGLRSADVAIRPEFGWCVDGIAGLLEARGDPKHTARANRGTAAPICQWLC